MMLVLLSLTLCQMTGCATMHLPTWKTLPTLTKGSQTKDDASAAVSQVVCIWQPAEGRGLDDLPTRGFAGQIVFLSATSPTPIEVAGDVTIYLFDDQASIEQQSRPLHVFQFVDGSWQTHLKATAWGPTYQLFLPYVRPGAHRASCSLAVQIDTPDGRRVTSAMANIVLPGSTSISGTPTLPFSPEHTRSPAGRVHLTGAASGDATQVVPASAESTSLHGRAFPPNNSQPATHREASFDRRANFDREARFESFSIPYDFRRTHSR